MATTDTFFQVTQGAGTKLHTFTRVNGVDTVHEGVYLDGIQPYPTYAVAIAGVSTATASSHSVQLMAGANLHLYVVRIKIAQHALASASTVQQFSIRRLTTAGTGGTVITLSAYDTTDPAAGASSMSLPTALGTEGNTLRQMTVGLTQTAPITNANSDEWIIAPLEKPIRIPAGVTNGLVVKNISAIATATVDINIEFFELAY